MGKNIFKFLKWYVVALFMITGVATLLIAQEHDSVRPLMFSVLSLGVAYILSVFWHKISAKLMLVGMATLVLSGFLTQYADMAFYVLSGEITNLGPYQLWAAVTFVVGLPVMSWAFSKYD